MLLMRILLAGLRPHSSPRLARGLQRHLGVPTRNTLRRIRCAIVYLQPTNNVLHVQDHSPCCLLVICVLNLVRNCVLHHVPEHSARAVEVPKAAVRFVLLGDLCGGTIKTPPNDHIISVPST